MIINIHTCIHFTQNKDEFQGIFLKKLKKVTKMFTNLTLLTKNRRFFAFISKKQTFFILYKLFNHILLNFNKHKRNVFLYVELYHIMR